MALYPPCPVFGPQVILDQAGNPIASESVTVYKADGSTLATLYTDQTGTTVAANPTTTDSNGNLTFFVAAAGQYVIATTIAGVSTAVDVFVAMFPGIQPFGFSGSPLVGSLPSGPDLPNFYALEWQTAISAGSDGLDVTNALPVAFPHAFCTFFCSPLAVPAGTGTMYLVNGYDYSSWTLSNFKVSIVVIASTQAPTTDFDQPSDDTDTIRCSFRVMGC